MWASFVMTAITTVVSTTISIRFLPSYSSTLAPAVAVVAKAIGCLPNFAG